MEEAEIRDVRFMCWDCLDWLQCANVEDTGGIVCATCGYVVPVIRYRMFSFWRQRKGQVDCEFTRLERNPSRKLQVRAR